MSVWLRHPLSLTWRISLLFSLAVAAVLLVTGVYLAGTVDAHFREGDRHELEGKLELIRHLLEGGGMVTPERLTLELDNALVGHHGLAVRIADGAGVTRYATAGEVFPAALRSDLDCRQPRATVRCLDPVLRQWRVGEHDYRGMVVPVRAGVGEVYRVAVALDIGHHRDFMARFRWTLAVAMALAALATAALGWFATRRGLAPLRRLRDLAGGISAERLATRLPERGLPEELHALADAFNAMLARLDDSFRRLSDFSSDIAHELRTPISNLMTQTQVALARTRSAEEYREVLQSAAEEYERLARMVGDMLFLAKADNRMLVPRREIVDLGREVEELIEFHGIVAEERGVCLERGGGGQVSGDRLMLRRALSNLLSNAIRHCPVGGTVRLAVAEVADGVRVAVENPGDVAAEHLPRLFDRFFTGDPSRRAGGEGVGLGLAIARSIIEMHGGRIEVTARDGRVCFALWLPTGR